MWKYDTMNRTWEHVFGNLTANAKADYDVPYLGGMRGHSMVIESTGRYLYVFGGFGLNNDSFYSID